ncbi:phage terminase large subunit family protein [Paenibacillus daejeonensis]|uniref:phage terminase large subunit family protein n=1 Tax=Paenibacillus daejeonensis TaxID=135193 RepID=UPI00035E6A0E|nr:phage terminase large subunit family protein [Paenibacillus daejeonensis]
MSETLQQTRNLFREIVRVVAPPAKLNVSEWADRYRILSSESSAEPGPWRTSRAPFQREPMNAISDSRYETIVLMWSSQVGKTELELNAVGYFSDHDPAPMMFVQPTLIMAQDFSKDRLAPMYRDSPKLRDKIRSPKSRDSGNTVLRKSFPGGQIALAGANSPASLASRPIRVVLCDEIDRYPLSAGTEGDPVSLVTKRTTTFSNRKRILVSTPTIKGISRIEKFYEDSTKEEWCLPCPTCEDYQPLKWKNIVYEYDEEDKKTTKAEMRCSSCGFLHSEQEWKANHEQTGRWIAQRSHSTTRGFHLNELASTFTSWETIVHNWKEANAAGTEALKTWINTAMAETWEEKGEQLDEEILLNRRELYHADVPDGVKVLTAAVDTQDNRFEVEVQGWGVGHENWRIQYHVIYGDLKQPQVWADLDEFLQRTWSDAGGRTFPIAISCMDSGGHFTNEVYKFCKERHGRRLFAIRGENPGDGTYLPLIAGTSSKNRYNATVVRLGVHEGKTKVMSAVRQPPVDDQGNKTKGYCHFPLTTPEKNRGYERQYFEGLTAEALHTRYKAGSPYHVWVKVRERNEPLDLAVYNRAAIEILQPNLDAELPPPKPSSQADRKPKRRRGTTSSV